MLAEPAIDPVQIDRRDKITLIGLNRPEARNAVNQDMARQLTVAFQAFENDDRSNVAVLHGIGWSFTFADFHAEVGGNKFMKRLRAECIRHSIQ